MGKNRNRLSIIANILESASEGTTKTGIMFGANLSFKLLKKYLELVVNAGFVQVDNSTYSLTDRGSKFLDRYHDFHRRYAKAQKLIEALGSEHTKLTMMLLETPNVSPIEPIKESA